tara:strand:+ start:135 stop:479 length:345 start_codon:yes stop_codon:yes gene_type:complete
MTTQRKGILAEVTAKAHLLKDPDVLTILEPLKAYGIIDILLVTKDFKIKCYDVKFESYRKIKNKKKTAYLKNIYRINRQLNSKQKEFANVNNLEFGIIYVSKNGKCTIKNYKNK